MREFTIGKNDAGQRLDRFVSKALPLLPPALLQKYIRIKRIKLNGGRAQRDSRLAAGDVLQLAASAWVHASKPARKAMISLVKSVAATADAPLRHKEGI